MRLATALPVTLAFAADACFMVKYVDHLDALAARNIGIDEVQTAAQAGNVNLPTGTLEGAKGSAVIQANGQLMNADTFRQQIVAYRNGNPVRFQDIGIVRDDVENNKVATWYNGERAIVLAIQRQPGSNTIAVVDGIRKVLPNFVAQLPPAASLEWTVQRLSRLAGAEGQFEHQKHHRLAYRDGAALSGSIGKSAAAPGR